MAEAWDEIQALKNKRNALREKIEKRKKERHGFLYKIVDVKPKIEAGGIHNFDATRNLPMSTKDTPSDMEAGIEKAILQMFSSSNLVLPIISTQIMEKLEKSLSKTPTRASVDYILGKLATQGAVCLQNVTIDQEVGCEVIAVNSTLIEEMHQEHVNEHFDMKDEYKHKKLLDDVGSPPAKSIKIDSNDSAASDEIMSLLALPSTREKQSKQVGEEILELLTKPTAKERSVVEKFKSHGGAQVMEFCPHGTKVECLKAQQAMAELEAKKRRERKLEKQQQEILSSKTKEADTVEQNFDLQTDDLKVLASAVEPAVEIENLKANEKLNGDNTIATTEELSEEESITAADTCTKLHFKKIIQIHTDESLGDCSFLNTCFHMATCKYVHYEVDTLPSINNAKPANVKSNICLKRGVDPSVTLYPPQWIQCDLRFLDMTVLGKFAVVMADPPWDIHMELPYGTMSDDEMRQLGVPALQDDGLIFLWVTGRAMELGRECLQLWGYERVDELIWVKTNQLQRIIRTGRTGHWLNHGKEHCLVGMKGNPKNLNRGLDCDVIVAEVRATSHKPDEIYGIIERLSPGTRKIELFGRPHNVQPNWITLGNQLDGIRLVDPELITQFQKRYPDGNCMAPAATVGVSATVPLTVSTTTTVKN